MHPLRLLGLVLLGLAFLAAAFEVAARGLTRGEANLSAAEVLTVFLPDALDAARLAVSEALAPAVWDYLFAPLLGLPGWLILSVPGAILFWRNRSDVGRAGAGENSFPDATYEDIVAAAKEADEDDIGLPSKYRDLDEYDPARRPPEGEYEDAPDPNEEPLSLTWAHMREDDEDRRPESQEVETTKPNDDPPSRPS